MKIDNSFSLITGIMRRFASTGDASLALTKAMPDILYWMQAEAGSLFLYRPEHDGLECVVCEGPVDIKGLIVPAGEGIIGRVYEHGTAELVTDAKIDTSHFRKADEASGFVSKSVATAPVAMPDHKYGAIQIINRKPPDDTGNSPQDAVFAPDDLDLLKGLGDALALALSHVDLTNNAILDERLHRDLAEAKDTQRLLMPDTGKHDMIDGMVIPARQIAGDFFDYIMIRDQLIFCQGDVAGKGVGAGLLMARCLTLFRYLARQHMSCWQIVHTINTEWLMASSGLFATMVVGTLNTANGEAMIINCGHGPMFCVANDDDDDEAADTIDRDVIASHLPPVGVVAYDQHIAPWQGQLDRAMLYLFTDGVSEAMTSDAVLGVEGIYHLAKQHHGLSPTQRVAAIRQMFENGQLTTHDDATLMVIGKLSLPSHSDIKTSAKHPAEAVFLVKPASLPEARRFLEKVVADLGWSHRLMDIQVATGEILQNIIRYAVWKHRNQGRITIRVCRDGDDLNILVHDNAAPGQHEDWYKCAEAKRPSEGGLGLKLVSRLTDAVTFSHDAGNQVALKYNYHQKSQQ
jgi:sigma-B regulation protein RsbU (phosphoserine phosphatase)